MICPGSLQVNKKTGSSLHLLDLPAIYCILLTMKVSIQSPATKKFISLYIPLEGRIYSESGQMIATLEYRHSSDCFPKLSIQMGENTIEIRSDCRTGSKGEICFNGSRRGRFDCTISHYPMFFDKTGRRILHMETDDSDRRFLWAFRNGFSKKEANTYAAARHALLVGPDYVLASINSSVYGPDSLLNNSLYPLMNEPDEQMWASQPTETQLLILTGACWWLCYGLHYASKESEHAVRSWDVQVSVPSTRCLEGRLTLNPEHLPPVNARTEYLATQPLIAGIWLVCGLLLGLVILPLRQQEFNADCLAATIYTSLIPAIWLVVRHFLRSRSAGKIKAIEEQINSANQA